MAQYSLKGCIWWCGSDISIKLLFKKYPCLSLLVWVQLLDLWSPATAAGSQEVTLPVLPAALDSVVSLCFCPDTCRSCHMRSTRGPRSGQNSELHLKHRGPGLGLYRDTDVQSPCRSKTRVGCGLQATGWKETRGFVFFLDS